MTQLHDNRRAVNAKERWPTSLGRQRDPAPPAPSQAVLILAVVVAVIGYRKSRTMKRKE
ncbi:hypothetical protein BT67DRAFT_445683 [Trichocladium antarcticum]|uniref:Uncharacterized protein n=1 Tax=Trichocladium antarcticum TaxID=1450529 RepID=A0AAN6UD21_9PEZI|nr:hypothetical protein BT67DRAFT_445683 [Trichocladium antarcticum]